MCSYSHSKSLHRDFGDWAGYWNVGIGLGSGESLFLEGNSVAWSLCVREGCGKKREGLECCTM